MTEQERKIVIDRINKNIEKSKLREEKIKRKEELQQCDQVKEYLELLSEIKKLDSELMFLNTEKDMIRLEFIWGFNSKVKSEGFSPCSHDIWIYLGSYGLLLDPQGEHDIYYLCEEDDEKFSHNKYFCLECGKTICLENWQQFEKDNLVLKNKDDRNGEKYQQLYYQLLYQYEVSKSRDMVINEFNKNKKLIKKKNDK